MRETHPFARFTPTLAASLLVALFAACSGQPANRNAANTPAPTNAPPATNSSTIPEPVDTTKVLPYDLVAVDFVDASNGWIVGSDAEQNFSAILHTTDGGATWVQQVDLQGDTLLDVDFGDATNGWAVGVEGIVYRTTDGGKTWAPEKGAGGAWVAQRTQAPVAIPSKSDTTSHALISESIASILFTDAKTGWAAGDTPTGKGLDVRGLVLGTSDGGKTWKELTDASGKGAPFSINDIWFVSATEGWAAGGNTENNEEDILLHTTDGGRTWERQRTGTAQFLRAVHFVDPQRGWVVGMTIDAVNELPGPSKLLATEDGGKTWKVQFVSPRSFFDVTFADARHGWAVGDRAAIYATADGGATWTQQTRIVKDGMKTMTAPEVSGKDDDSDVPAFRCVFALTPAAVWAGGQGFVLKRR